MFSAFPGALELWPVAWVALVPLLWAVKDAKPRYAARLGFAAGLLHHITLMYWIVIVLGEYGYLPLWVSIPALLLLAIYMSLYTSLFAAVTCWTYRGLGMAGLWIAPLFWVGLDYVRGWIFTGFPWQDLAYTQYKMPHLFQTSDLTGHFGITFHIVLTNCLVFVFLLLFVKNNAMSKALFSKKRQHTALFFIIPALMILVPAMSYNVFRFRQVEDIIINSDSMRVAVVQGNISQDLKWTPEMQEKTVSIYSKLSENIILPQKGKPEPALIIWPETALPFYLQGKPNMSSLLAGLGEGHNTWLLTGVPYYDMSEEFNLPDSIKQTATKYYNSAIMVSPNGSITDRYDKQHLVPFGEYMPFRKLPIIGSWLDKRLGPVVQSMGDFESGSSSEPLTCSKARIGVLICFESIFPNIARISVENGANLLVNITNDAWFGRSSAPWQHLSMAVFRAVENRRSLVRSANTGVSGFIDPLGRVPVASPLFKEWQQTAEVKLLQEKTFFLKIGHYFGALCLALSVCVMLIACFRSKERYLL